MCLGKGLVIEVDGDYHLYTQEQDELRTAVLNEKGFEVIGFGNNDVIKKPQSVFINIKAQLDAHPNRTLT